MAYSASKTEQTVFGNQRVWQGVVTADAASGTVSVGFNSIIHVEWSPVSMTSTGIRVRKNATAAGVASNGTIGISGAVSGDEIYFTVYGK